VAATANLPVVAAKKFASAAAAWQRGTPKRSVVALAAASARLAELESALAAVERFSRQERERSPLMAAMCLKQQFAFEMQRVGMAMVRALALIALSFQARQFDFLRPC
jgi:hypothetical protein